MKQPVDLSQPGCLIEGITQLLSFAAGDFAVVLHSEPDCANLVFRDSRAVDPRRFLCTNLTEEEAVAGRGKEKLARATAEARRRCGPKGTVFVLGGCVASLMGEDIEAAARRGAGRGRLVVLSGAAFGKVGQAESIDRFCALLLQENLPVEKRKRRGRYAALLGYPDDGGECGRFLASSRIGLCRLDLAAGFADWKCLRQSPLLVIPDRALFARTGSVWEERGLALAEAPLPLGLLRSLEFYRGLQEALGLGSTKTRALERQEKEAQQSIQRIRRGGARRLAFHVGSRKDFEVFTSAYGGLAALPLFLELGFDVALFFQGAVERERKDQIRGLLDRYGISRPFVCLPDRLSLARALRDGRYDAVFCDESLREEAAAARTPMITREALHFGLAGVAPTCREIERVLTNSTAGFARKKA
jgi:nitrogenase molybdenum-iron protein alpha/beta subunit